MRFFLDTNAIVYLLDKKNNIVNNKFYDDCKKNTVEISIYSIFELLNQLPNNEFILFIQNLKSKIPNLIISTNSIFDNYITDYEIYNLDLLNNYDGLFNRLAVPIISEYKRNIINRIVISLTVYINCFLTAKEPNAKNTKWTELILRIKQNIDTHIYLKLLNLRDQHLLVEREIKSLYRDTISIIFYEMVRSFNLRDDEKIINTLLNINLNQSISWDYSNYLKIDSEVIKIFNSKLSFLNQSEINKFIVDYLFKYFKTNNKFDNFDKIIIKIELKNIFLNNNVLTANNYIDYSILKFYLHLFNEYQVNSKKNDYFFITFDEKLKKRFELFNQKCLKDSLKKCNEYKKYNK